MDDETADWIFKIQSESRTASPRRLRYWFREPAVRITDENDRTIRSMTRQIMNRIHCIPKRLPAKLERIDSRMPQYSETVWKTLRIIPL